MTRYLEGLQRAHKIEGGHPRRSEKTTLGRIGSFYAEILDRAKVIFLESGGSGHAIERNSPVFGT
jgi:hypothetical protein